MLAPAEQVVLGPGKTVTNPAGWKVLCGSSRVNHGDPAMDARYAYDDEQKSQGFAKQYVLKEILERMQKGARRGGHRGGRAVRRTIAARGGHAAGGRAGSSSVNKLEGETVVATPDVDDQNARIAHELWDEAEAWSPVIDCYMRARGRDPEKLRPLLGGWMRFHPACPMAGYADEQGRSETLRLPTVLMAVTNVLGEVVAVHRIAVMPDGSGKSDAVSNPKKLLGSPLPGSFIDIPGEGDNEGLLIACEGPETGWAIAEATGARVAVCVSAGGLERLELPAEHVREGLINTLVIAADVDREKWMVRDQGRSRSIGSNDPLWRSVDARQVGMTGQLVARRAARARRDDYPGLAVGLAMPKGPLVRWDAGVVDAHGRPVGEMLPRGDAKSVDWEDIANAEGGREAVREAMASAIRLAVATAPPDEPVDRVDDGASLPPL
ncbi:MAG: hypothetical protein AAFR96_07620, partial [Planctomycetota bacterium]